MRPTDEKEIEQKIKAIKDNKAVGPNSTRTKILKVQSKTLISVRPTTISYIH